MTTVTVPTDQSQSVISQAPNYARRGWLIIPLHGIRDGACTCGKQECKRGKHPILRNWPKLATTDEMRIRGWWEKWPNANIGIVTGRESRLFAVDVDGEQGKVALRQLLNEYNWTPQTLTNITYRGFHLVFRYPALDSNHEIATTTSRNNRLGMDVRGDGGYIVAPPSLHESGLQYAWEEPEPTPEEAPEWLVTMLVTVTKTATRWQDAFPTYSRPSNSLPDMAYIRERIPVADVAALLGLEPNGTACRCWRPEAHRNGDGSPSVSFGHNNRAHCHLCDEPSRWWSNIDIAMKVKRSSGLEAARWIAEHFPDVPTIAKGKRQTLAANAPSRKNTLKDALIETVVHDGVLPTLTGAEFKVLGVLRMLSDETGTVRISYDEILRRSAIGSRDTICRSITRFQKIGLLQIIRGVNTKGRRTRSSYRLTPNSRKFTEYVSECSRWQKNASQKDRKLRKGESVHTLYPLPRVLL